MENTVSRRGSLIVFEGIDKSGKTTQARLVYERLLREGHRAEFFCFPDRTTPIGKVLNAYLTGHSDSTSIAASPQLMHLLFAANRWELQPQMTKALNEGCIAIVDRYSFSGIAYSTAAAPAAAAAAANILRQNAAASKDSDEVATSVAFSDAAVVPIDVAFCQGTEKGLLAPDLVIYLDVAPEQAQTRNAFGEELYEDLDIQKNVRAAFNLFVGLPFWKRIPAGSVTPEELHRKIYEEVEKVACLRDGCSTIDTPMRLWEK